MSTSSNTSDQKTKPNYPYIAIGGGVLLLLLGMCIGSWAAAVLVGGSGKVASNTNPPTTQQDKPPDDEPLDTKPGGPIIKETRASDAVHSFMTLLVEQKPDKAYDNWTSEYFKNRRTTNEFRKYVDQYPAFNSFGGTIHYDPGKPKTGKYGEKIYKGSVRGAVSTSRFTIEVKVTDQGWQVNEFSIQD